MNDAEKSLRTKIARQAQDMARSLDGRFGLVWMQPLEMFFPKDGAIYLEQRARLVAIPDQAEPPFGDLLHSGEVKPIAELHAHSLHEPRRASRIVTPQQHVVMDRRCKIKGGR